MANAKWYLITTLDDYSRDMLYADLWDRETSWAHIMALKSVVMRFGYPFKYYVDQHSIFKFVERRDTLWKKTHLGEEDAFVQWKEVLKDLKIEVVYALSPQAKGKIERPYRWLQDHLVRTCVREGVTRIEQARQILYEEVHQYRYKRLHSTTLQIPSLRLEKACMENRSMFGSFVIPKPYQSLEDIFCYRFKRTVDAYRRISFKNLQFSITNVPAHQEVELRISFNLQTKMALIRFWYQGQLVGQQNINALDIQKVHF